MPENLENSAVATGLEKIHFHSNPQKRRCQRMLTTTQLHSSHMLKILQVRLQQYANYEFPDVQARFRKGRGTGDQIANIHWIKEKAREFQKSIYFCFSHHPKPLTVWMTTKCVKFLKRWEYQITLFAS